MRLSRSLPFARRLRQLARKPTQIARGARIYLKKVASAMRMTRNSALRRGLALRVFKAIGWGFGLAAQGR